MSNELTARDVMTTKVLTVQGDWPITRLAEFLVDNGISGAPVLSEDGRLMGVVSVTDVVRHDSLPHKEPQTHSVHEYYVMALEDRYAEEDVASFHIDGRDEVLVRDIMTPTLFKVHENTTLGEIADLMITGRIHRVFVTRGQHIVGLVSALDMLRVIRDR